MSGSRRALPREVVKNPARAKKNIDEQLAQRCGRGGVDHVGRVVPASASVEQVAQGKLHTLS